MNILAFDTCFAACSVAVGRNLHTGSGVIEQRFEPMETGHAERLVPMVAETLAAAHLTLGAIDRIAVTMGPGTFTGTRISVAAARAFGLAGTADCVAVSSLAVMAVGARLRIAPILDGQDLAVVVDARRGEVYVQVFRDGADADGGSDNFGPALLTVADAAAIGGTRPVVYVGSAGEAVCAAARGVGRDARFELPDLLPEAGNLVRIAVDGAPSEVRPSPLYLRPADAKPQTGKSIERARS
ncbi:MAG: tRNA (adenosine(37)-N6)-threonylcarbamoyltransferase complex dimerization subunit type 1 TsaB [Hyphomicrobiaceae bacterium]|nr:tRNA (adenosine(37)-N6)-threonylcarbamoyltransferase complex dimerization subunit type 1 TsaB [Hyphomicrobiaceae bacterium]